MVVKYYKYYIFRDGSLYYVQNRSLIIPDKFGQFQLEIEGQQQIFNAASFLYERLVGQIPDGWSVQFRNTCVKNKYMIDNLVLARHIGLADGRQIDGYAIDEYSGYYITKSMEIFTTNGRKVQSMDGATVKLCKRTGGKKIYERVNIMEIWCGIFDYYDDDTIDVLEMTDESEELYYIEDEYMLTVTNIEYCLENETNRWIEQI